MFCNNCGKEVADNAYVCTGCGCLVNEENKAVAKKEKVKAKIAKILLILSFSFFCCALFWAYYSICAGAYLAPWVQSLMWLSALAAFSVGVPAFIFGLKLKNQPSLKLLTILNFILTLTIELSSFCCILAFIGQAFFNFRLI